MAQPQPDYSPAERDAAQVIASLIYADWPGDPLLGRDVTRYGIYETPITALYRLYDQVTQVMIRRGEALDAVPMAADLWEGFRNNSTPERPYARIDPLLRSFSVSARIAWHEQQRRNETPAAPAPPQTEYTATPTLPIDSNDLLAMERQPVKWFAPSFLREGLGLLVGLPQVGKTPLALQLGIAIATGGKWMGRVQCRQARTLYLGVEYTRQELIPLLDISRCGAAIDRGMLIFKTMEDEFPNEPEAALAELEWYISVLEVEVIIIDVLTAFLPPEKFKQNVYRGDYTELKPYHRLASLHHAAILGTWHGSKREVDPRLMYNGSVGLWAVPASRMALYTDQEQRVRLSTFPRMCDRLDWALTQERTEGGRRWVVSDAAPEPMCSPTELTIYRFLKENASKERPFSPSTIAEWLPDLKAGSIKVMLRRMFDQNMVQQSGSGYYVEDVTGVTSVTDVTGVTSVTEYFDASGNNGYQNGNTSLPHQNEVNSPGNKSNTILQVTDIFDAIPPGRRTVVRVYLQSRKPQDQERAAELCAEYGIDYAAALAAVKERI
jgi:AAA domain-containing protein